MRNNMQNYPEPELNHFTDSSALLARTTQSTGKSREFYKNVYLQIHCTNPKIVKFSKPRSNHNLKVVSKILPISPLCKLPMPTAGVANSFLPA